MVGVGVPGSGPEESASEEVLDRLAQLLPADALEDALEGLRPEEITGPGGLITQLAGRVVEAALAGELSEHLGYPPGQAPPGGAGNVRNGSTPKTLKTELPAISPITSLASTASQSAATPSRGSLTRSWRTSPRGARGRLSRSIRSSISTRCT